MIPWPCTAPNRFQRGVALALLAITVPAIAMVALVGDMHWIPGS